MNLARTTPEFPIYSCQLRRFIRHLFVGEIITVRSGNLAPDHSDLGASLLVLCAVDIGDTLAKVEAMTAVRTIVFAVLTNSRCYILGSIGVINSLQLEQTDSGVSGVSVSLVAQVATPIVITRQS